jgi:hypothetical protein
MRSTICVGMACPSTAAAPEGERSRGCSPGDGYVEETPACDVRGPTLVAPEVGLPPLFIKADNCTEGAAKIAVKFDEDMHHFHRTVKDTDGQHKPMRRRSGPHPISSGRRVASAGPARLPPDRQAARAERMEKVTDLTCEHWQGHGADGFHLY